jgi:hypothetical protein
VTTPIRTWTRSEIEEAAAKNPEGVSYLRVRISMKLLKTLIDWAFEHGEIIEIVSAHPTGPTPIDAELHFFKKG